MKKLQNLTLFVKLLATTIFGLMLATTQNQLIDYLQQDLEVPADWITFAQAHCEVPSLLPIVLWQHGMLDLEQLEQVFNWLETADCV